MKSSTALQRELKMLRDWVEVRRRECDEAEAAVRTLERLLSSSGNDKGQYANMSLYESLLTALGPGTTKKTQELADELLAGGYEASDPTKFYNAVNASLRRLVERGMVAKVDRALWSRGTCRICGQSGTTVYPKGGDWIDMQCPSCGRYRVSGTADTVMPSEPNDELVEQLRRYLASMRKHGAEVPLLRSGDVKTLAVGC